MKYRLSEYKSDDFKMKSSKINLSESYSCKIRLLDDVELSFDFKKEAKGFILLDHISEKLDLIEKDYFGLRYVDNNKQRHWLESSKEVLKQLKDCRQPCMFFFRVKFYPTDPTKVKEEITRYYLYLQLKRDILHGRLLCPFNNITDLAAHIVQAEIGDYNEEEHGETYLSTMKLLPRQNEKLEEKIMEYHKTLVGYNPAEAENRFLNLARSQDLYGVDPHPCKDQEDLPLYLGLTPQGIQIIREARRVSGFIWSDVNKVSYDNKIFYVQTLTDKEKTNYAFRLNDTPSCKHLWKCAVEQMSFYSEEPVKTQVPKRSALSPQNIFRRSKYKFSGKTEHDLRNDTQIRPFPPTFIRKSSLRLSLQSNGKKNFSSMADLLPKQNGDIKLENNDAPVNLSQPTTPSKTRETDYDLASFQTKNFPREPESSRDSMMFDNVSTSSSHESNNIPPILQQPSPGTSQQTSPPIINVHDVDEPPVNVAAVSETTVETDKQQELQQQQQIQPSIIATTNFTDLYKNPFFLLLLLAAAMIPVAIVLQMKFKS